MKNLLLLMCAAVICSGCERIYLTETSKEETNETKKFTFTLKGDFGNSAVSATETRGYLQANGQDLTDLWVFDYVGNTCMQTLHQTASDEAWGKPSMSLTYGTHHIYFVASRGTDPSIDADAHSMSWTKPSDTFWADYEVSVVSTSNGNRAVTLDRVVTKLKITATDEVPAGASTLSITPSIWYCGLDYLTGNPTYAKSNVPRTVSIPSSYVGTVGTLSMSIFSFSETTVWPADLSIVAKNGNNATIGQASINGAMFTRNRATELSGPLFGGNGMMVVSINDSWSDPFTGTW